MTAGLVYGAVFGLLLGPLIGLSIGAAFLTGYFRILFYVLKIVPKVGPFRPLAFEPLTPEAERLFVESFETARERYLGWVVALRKGPITLPNSDLDTGQPPNPAANPLVAETTGELSELRGEKSVVGSR